MSARRQHTRMVPAADQAKTLERAQALAKRGDGSAEPQQGMRSASEAPGWFRGARVRKP
jgi:hypothetical protein